MLWGHGVCCSSWFSFDSLFLDKNECLQFGICSHMCNNTKGSYKCSCHKYFTRINDTCKADSEISTLFLVWNLILSCYLFQRLWLLTFVPPRHEQQQTDSLHCWWQWNPQPGPWNAQLALRADVPGGRQCSYRCDGPAREDQPHLLDQLAHRPHLLLRTARTVDAVHVLELSSSQTAERRQDHKPAGETVHDKGVKPNS